LVAGRGATDDIANVGAGVDDAFVVLAVTAAMLALVVVVMLVNTEGLVRHRQSPHDVSGPVRWCSP
jgi:hypothetical protein